MAVCLHVFATNSMIIATVMSKAQALIHNHTRWVDFFPIFDNAFELIVFITISNHFIRLAFSKYREIVWGLSWIEKSKHSVLATY